MDLIIGNRASVNDIRSKASGGIKGEGRSGNPCDIQ